MCVCACDCFCVFARLSIRLCVCVFVCLLVGWLAGSWLFAIGLFVFAADINLVVYLCVFVSL